MCHVTEGRQEVPRQIYLVLEYCESDLSGIVRTCSLTPQHVRSYMYQILRGLAYIQRHGLLHRDLKSACRAVPGRGGAGRGGAASRGYICIAVAVAVGVSGWMRPSVCAHGVVGWGICLQPYHHHHSSQRGQIHIYIHQPTPPTHPQHPHAHATTKQPPQPPTSW
jgi:hypothetical protein